MLHPTKVQTGIAIILLMLGSFTAGRNTEKSTVKLVVKTVEVEKVVEQQQHSVTTITTKPDGSKEETITKDTSTHSNTNSDTNISSTEKSSPSKGSFTLQALAGYDIGTTSLVYGISISKTVLGPISVGVWGLSDKTIGASIGLTF